MGVRTNLTKRWRPDIEIFVALCMSSFAVGALTPEGFVVAALGLIPLLWRERRGIGVGDTHNGRFAILFAACIIGFDLFVAVPLPHFLVRLLSPQTASVWADALDPIGQKINWHSISLEPFASTLDALRVALYLLFFLAIRSVIRTPGGNVRVERALLAATCTLAAVAMIHPALGAERVFGLYKPETSRGIRLTPLLNPNHLAAYLSPGILLAIQQAQDRKPSIPRVYTWCALAVCSVTMAFAASRGGTLALAIGAVALVLTRRSGKQRITASARWRALVAIGAVFVLFGVVMVVLPQIRAELVDSDMTKAQIWQHAARLLPNYKAFGVGRGAFGSAIAGVAGITNNESPTHPENLLLQVLTEYGWLWGCAVLAGGAWLLRPELLARAERTAVWAYWATATLVLHDMADYALEVPAVGLLMALLVARYLPTRVDAVVPIVRGVREAPTPPLRRFLWAGAASLAGLGYLVGVHAPARELREAYTYMAHAPLSEARVESLVKRHPASAYAALIGALSEPALGSERAIAWCGRALTLASSNGVPVYGRAHAVLAGHLRQRNPRQSLLEYGHALSDDVRLTGAITAEVLASVHDGVDLHTVLPSASHASLRAVLLGDWWPSLWPRLPSSMDAERRALGPEGDKNLRLLHARIVESSLDARAGAPWCTYNGQQCAAESVAGIALLQKVSSDMCEAPGLLLELSEGTPLYDRAAEAAEKAYVRSDNRDRCALTLMRSYARQHAAARFDAFASAIRKWPCRPDAGCVAVLLEAAQQDVQLGHREKALAELRRIEREVSDAQPILEASGALAVALGMHAEAAESYRRLSRRVPSRTDFAALADAEETLAKAKRIQAPALSLPASSAP